MKMDFFEQMTLLQALVLGVIQGITEFLPVSSSAHLVIVQSFFGLEGSILLVFDVVVHLGTLAAVLIYFAKDLSQLGRALLRAVTQAPSLIRGVQGNLRHRHCEEAIQETTKQSQNPEIALRSLGSEGPKEASTTPGMLSRSDEGPPKIGGKLMGLIVLATIPTAIIGFGIKGWIDFFFTSLKPVAIALLVNSLVLWSTKWIGKESLEKPLGWVKATWIGIVQGISVVPGISRAGATISAGLWLKLNREEAVRFSFFLAIPAILGAMVVVLPETIRFLPRDAWRVLAAGFLAAFGSGYLAISVLFKIVLRGKLHYFAVYTLLLAVVAFFFSGF